MLLVIFGAGASHGCSPSGHDSLPLTNGLFDPADRAVREASLKFPEAGGLISHVRRELGTEGDVESILEARAKDSENPQVLAQMLAMRYWLTERILLAQDEVRDRDHTITFYSELIDQLGQRVASNESIVLVTFNYDTLLDDALAAAIPEFARDVEKHGVRGYLTASGWTLLRPHGSAGWHREVPVEGLVTAEAQSQYGMVKHLDLKSSKIEIGRAREALPIGNYSVALRVPAIAVPLLSKTDFEMPADHLDALVEAVKGADRIVAVGWRGREGHMRKVLKLRADTTPIIFVDPSPKAALRAASEMRDAIGGKTGLAEYSFSDIISDTARNPMFGDRASWSELA